MNEHSGSIRVPCIAILQSGFGTKREVYIESETEGYFYGETDDGIPTGFLKSCSALQYDSESIAGWAFVEYVEV